MLYLPHLGCRGCYWFITGAIDLQRGGSWAGQTTKQEEIRLKSLKCLGEEGAATWAESWHEKWPPGYGDTLFHYRVSHQQGPCKLQTFKCKRVFACPVAQVINSSCVWRGEDEMVGGHRRFDGREFEQAPGIGDGRGSLACCLCLHGVAKSQPRLSD